MKTARVTRRRVISVVETLSKRLTDPRNNQGKRYTFLLMLLLCVGAVAAGSNTLEAIARFADDRSAKSLTRRVRRGGPMPGRTTIRNFLERIGPNELLRETKSALENLLPKSKMKGIAIDGKALNAAHAAGKRTPILVSAVFHALGIAIAQENVDIKSNEISVFKSLLKPLDIVDYVVTADAIQTQRANAEFIVNEKKAHYLFPVKENQPNLLQALIDESLISREHDAESLEKGHGRIEKRTIWIYEAPANIKESFPFVEQICAIERTRTVLGNEEKTTTEVSYYVTSLSKNDAAASTILSLIRGHWVIESKVHHCLDVAFDEDRCRARTGNLPFVLSALKKAVMTIFRAFGVRNITGARQQLAQSL